MADKIYGIVINLFRVPLEEALYDAKHGSLVSAQFPD